MAGVKLDALELIKISSRGFHELHCPIDFSGKPLVAGICRVFSKPFVPAVDHPEISKTTLGEGANQVQRRCRSVVPLKHPRGVRSSRLGSEIVSIDDVAAVRGKRDSVSCLVVIRARLSKLPGHTPHLHNRQGSSVRQNHRHLQDGLDSVSNFVSRRARKSLRAIAALKQERFAPRDSRQTVTQDVYLTRKYQRRHGSELCHHSGSRGRIWPFRLLLNGQSFPVVEALDNPRVRGHDVLVVLHGFHFS